MIRQTENNWMAHSKNPTLLLSESNEIGFIQFLELVKNFQTLFWSKEGYYLNDFKRCRLCRQEARVRRDACKEKRRKPKKIEKIFKIRLLGPSLGSDFRFALLRAMALLCSALLHLPCMAQKDFNGTVSVNMIIWCQRG